MERFMQIREKAYKYIIKSNYLEVKAALKKKDGDVETYFGFDRNTGTSTNFAKLSTKYQIPLIVSNQIAKRRLKEKFPKAIIYSADEELKGRRFNQIFVDVNYTEQMSYIRESVIFNRAYINISK